MLAARRGKEIEFNAIFFCPCITLIVRCVSDASTAALDALADVCIFCEVFLLPCKRVSPIVNMYTSNCPCLGSGLSIDGLFESGLWKNIS